MEKKIGRKRVEFFDTKDDLPIKRFQRFQKYVMLDSQVGSTFQSFSERIDLTHKFLTQGMIKQAQKEMENLRQCVFNIFEEYDPKLLAYAILVKSINGRKIIRYDDEALIEVIKELSRSELSRKEVNQLVDEVKKKLKRN
jgi:hypothetical protein